MYPTTRPTRGRRPLPGGTRPHGRRPLNFIQTLLNRPSTGRARRPLRRQVGGIRPSTLAEVPRCVARRSARPLLHRSQ